MLRKISQKNKQNQMAVHKYNSVDITNKRTTYKAPMKSANKYATITRQK